MNNLENALIWLKAGASVFPCYEADEWDGQLLHERKSPRTKHGFDDATNSVSAVTKYWTEYPEHLVGVFADRMCVLDVDMDFEEGKDGWGEIEDAGLEIPETIHARTPRGGAHYFFRQPDGASLGPVAGLLLPDGRKLPSVDRRAGGSYFIAWTDLAPSSVEDLPDAPEWLCRGRSNSSLSGFSGTVSEWEAKVPDGPATRKVNDKVADFPSGEFGHHEMISLQASLVSLGSRGHAGTTQALSELQNLWLAGKYDTLHYRAEWDAALAGAVSKYGGNIANVSKEDRDFESEVEHALFNLRVRSEAELRLALEHEPQLEFIDISNFESTAPPFIVEDLVWQSGVTFFCAKPNIGKTFAYVDMVCRMAFGQSWLGKKTRNVNVLIVLGEGQAGFPKRLSDWCAVHKQNFGKLRERLTVISNVNLSSKTSVSQIQELVGERAIQLVVFDTWSNVSGVLDEDAAAQTAKVLNNMTTACPSTALFFVHHPRKGDENTDHPVLRGSGVLNGRADVVMTMFNDKSDRRPAPGAGGWLAISTEASHAGKNRHAMNETVRSLVLREFDGLVVFNHESGSAADAKSLEGKRLLTRPMKVADFCKVSGYKKSKAREILSATVEAGYARITMAENPNLGYLYSPIDENETDWSHAISRLTSDS